ncbi:MAG TPA: FAD-dependent oxidoreductase [Gemmataceae bacterium]|nr:FAD-dependent oxidoreductase [Gemmataceae bacterium]
MTGTAPARTRVAILGGGVGAITAAYALTDRPGWSDRYEVTVYQMGWRLGGKGASGRNAARGQRIEEHGLHIWMGCYENAFSLMQRCYEELGRPAGSPLARWDDAFKPHSTVTLMEQVDGHWLPWASRFPTNDEVPGHGGVLLRPWDYVKMMLDFMRHLHERSPHAPRVHARWGDSLVRLVGWVEDVLEEIVADDAGGPAEVPATCLRHAHHLARALPDDPADHEPHHHEALAWLVGRFAKGLYHAVCDPVLHNDDLRRAFVMIDLMAATIRGLIFDGALYHGLDRLDDLDFREWLRKHGASESAVWSAPVKAVYDLVFAYEQGDPRRPNIAAGVALRTMLRTGWTYKGAFAWKMQAGMGDTVFTPFYEVLKRRGVKFAFFHRVEDLRLSADRARVEAIDVTVQATPKGGEYRPLVDVKGLGCWPSEPLYEQLAEGEELRQNGIDLESAWTPWPGVSRRMLKRGEDFDAVVLGVSVAALPYLTRELSAARPRWADMLQHVTTVQTQAFQLWLTRDAKELGWDAEEPAVVGSYPACWADMSHLLPREDWGDEVRNVSYFCYPLSEPEPIPAPGSDANFPRKEAERVKAESVAFLTRDVGALWPTGVAPPDTGPLDWSALVDPAGGAGQARFAAQFWRANIDPSERYVLSVKGSTAYRLASDQSGFENLYLAGDWTRNGLNAGCVEAAVISGLQAARAICGHPLVIVGEKDL